MSSSLIPGTNYLSIRISKKWRKKKINLIDGDLWENDLYRWEKILRLRQLRRN